MKKKNFVIAKKPTPKRQCLWHLTICTTSYPLYHRYKNPALVHLGAEKNGSAKGLKNSLFSHKCSISHLNSQFKFWYQLPIRATQSLGLDLNEKSTFVPSQSRCRIDQCYCRWSCDNGLCTTESRFWFELSSNYQWRFTSDLLNCSIGCIVLTYLPTRLDIYVTHIV